MTLLVEDLDNTRALDRESCRAVSGGIGPVGSDIGVAQLTGQSGQNSIVGSAASYGVLNTTLNLQLQVAPQISVSTANVVDLDSITDLTQVLNSVVA